jgi:hypothetical protein
VVRGGTFPLAMVDRAQLQALASRAQSFRERAPVHRVQAVPFEGQIKRAARLTALVWDLLGECAPRVVADESPGMARIQLPEDGNVNIYTPSGAIDAFITSAASRPPLAADERRAERPKIQVRLRQVAENLTKELITDGEELRPERLWETKARGQTMKGESSPTALLEVVGSLRRYLHGLPVLGRASVHVALGGRHEVTKWGVDWRLRDGDAIAETEVVDPDEGARRVLAELRNRRPESGQPPDLEPEEMILGYLSMPRRYEQRVLQPAWVARFRPTGGSTMGVVVAVPAAPAAFEPIGFPARPLRF